MDPVSLDRRELLRRAVEALGALRLLGAAGCLASSNTEPPATCLGPQPWAAPSNSEVTLPHLGGAPDDARGWTIAALVDTVIPGAHRDPLGAPGGIDVGAPALFFDPVLPAAAFVPLLAAVLDSFASDVQPRASSFAVLAPEDRERALELALEVEQMEFAVQLAKLAYFASRPAACHFGYPGPNPGYVRHPDFSLGRALTEELTPDGNFP